MSQPFSILAGTVLAWAGLLALPGLSFAQFNGSFPGDWAQPGRGPTYGSGGYGDVSSRSSSFYDGLSGSYLLPIAAPTGPVFAALTRGDPSPAPPAITQIRVHVPASALVFFDDSPTRQTGADRLFLSPALDRSQSYSYEITARWTQNGKAVRQTRTVRLVPGQTLDVDFTVQPLAQQGRR